jgi:hypothetical protein
LVQRSGLAKNWDLLAGFTLRNNGPLDVAERAARQAVMLDEGRWLYRSTLAMVLEKEDELEQAAACLEVTLGKVPDSWRAAVVERLQDVRRRPAAAKVSG